jgi:uncharacterized protein (TIGR02145 family)
MKNMNNMKKLYLPIAIMFLFVHVSFAQNFQLSFTGIGESTEIDSVIVKNLNLGVETKVGGYDVVNLAPAASLRFAQQTGDDLVIYPNPAYDYCTIELLNPEQNNVYIDVFDVSGKLLIREQYNLEKGIHRFRLNGMASGLYTISVKSNRFHYNGKIVSTSNTNKTLDFNYIDSYAFAEDLPLLSHTKASFDLAYNYGDVLWFEAQSDAGHRTVQTLILNEADAGDTYQNLDFEFITCQDAEGFMYSVIEMGNHHWMAENLNTSKYRDSSNIAKVDDTNEWIELTSGAYCNYDNNNSNPKLYNWYAATSSKGLCPTGWHTPADFEWKRLEQHIGLTQQQTDAIGWRGSGFGNYLKESGTDNWLSHTGTGLNTSGFTAVPGGIRNFAGEFYYSTTSATWWSSTENLPPTAWCRGLFFDKTEIYRKDGRKLMGLSIRCIKHYPPELNTTAISNITSNSATSGGEIINNGGADILERGIIWGLQPELTMETKSGIAYDTTAQNTFIAEASGLSGSTNYYLRAFAVNEAGVGYGEIENFTSLESVFACGDNLIDARDGNVYQTVEIENQCWMAENLAYLPSVVGPSTINHTAPYYYVYDYDGTNVNDAKAHTNYSNYGVLYNWMAAMDGASSSSLNPSNVKGACPEGWHLPSKPEWDQLINYLGADTLAGGKLKETGTLHWNSPNTGATNETGFNALPGGGVTNLGYFDYIGNYGIWWSATENDTINAWDKSLSYDYAGVYETSEAGKMMGYSVRCVQDFDVQATLPIVSSTYNITNITANTATCGGYVDDDGGATITARGVVWSTTPNPTIETNEGFTEDGTGTGSFTSELTGLTAENTYYVKAYASNEVGTAYGQEESFATPVSFNCGDEVTFIYNGSSVTYLTVESNGRCWLDRNLGAMHVAGFSTDSTSYGDLFQWGRAADGHQLIDWNNPGGTPISGTTSTLSSTDTPGHNDFILAPNAPNDWISPQNDNLWQGADGINNPCPSGWRVPTEAEWTTELNSWSSQDVTGAFASALKLTVAGFRNNSDGGLVDVGSFGYYWSSTVDGIMSVRLGFGSTSASFGNLLRAQGIAVRCIKDEETQASLPTISTESITNITDVSATSGGNITSNGGATITARGVVWSTTPNPTIETNEGFTEDGTGTGSFTSELTGLTAENTYYVKAYASNEVGTAYGQEESFSTTTEMIVWSCDFQGAEVWTMGSDEGTKTWNVTDTLNIPSEWGTEGSYYFEPLGVWSNENTEYIEDRLWAWVDGTADLLSSNFQICNTWVQFDNIDLSVVNNPVLKFTQMYKPLNAAYSYIDFSINQGSSWTEVQVNSELLSNEYGDFNYILEIGSYVANEPDVSIRFRWQTTTADMNGYGYGWQIDDIKIVE